MSAKDATDDVIPNDQPQAEIFKLKMDHFEELFDWLSLEDLNSLRKTCKKMNRIVGYRVKTNYGAITFEYRSDGIYLRNDVSEIKFDGLSSFLKRFVFFCLEDIKFDHWARKWKKSMDIIPHMKADRFKTLTEILLTRVVFTDDGISRIKEILGQLETVKVKFPCFYGENKEFYASFLQFCNNVKTLCIEGGSSTAIVGADNSWLLRKYPTLEHFELTTPSCSNHEISELQTFFEQNKHIKTFATSVEIISANRNIFVNTELKVEILSVEFCHTKTFNSSRDILNELYDHGLFKQLNVYFFTLYDSTFNQDVVTQLISFKGLTKLFIDGMEDGTDLSPLINLKELYLNRTSYIINKKLLSEQLINLKFIQFMQAEFDDIIPFIRYSPKLKAIAVFRLENHENIPSFEVLNRERSKLTNARKVIIYVEERVYLAVKWSKNQTNYGLIEIERGASYDALNHNFDYLDEPDMTF